jgi:hypothetical protein
LAEGWHAKQVQLLVSGARPKVTEANGAVTPTIASILDREVIANRVTATNPDGNYMVFSIPGTSFTLTATPTTATDGTIRAPVNGIQIVPE